GYGTVDARVWFLGMEEGGGGAANLRERLSFEAVEDLQNALLKLGIMKFHGDRPRIQSTWRGMCYIMLRLNGMKPTRDARRDYQAKQLSRAEGQTLLVELMPLPKQNLQQWDYLDVLPQFRSREDYHRRVKPFR